MPRTPRDATAVISLRPNVEVVKRIRPPFGCKLSSEEYKEFVRIVDALPADWFSQANVMMLVEYCRHVVITRSISEAIEKYTKKGNYDDDNFRELVKMHNAKTKLLHQLMTSMRLTQQSLIEKKTGKHSREIDMPWQYGDADGD